jgi:hypothetical protein
MPDNIHKEFDKTAKPREIFVYVCERVAAPLAAQGWKYRKSKNDIIRKAGDFTFGIFFQPSRNGSTSFWVHVNIESAALAEWRKKEYGNGNADGCVFSTYLARVTKREKECPRYDVTTPTERERVIAEVSEQIRDYALPFFARFDDLERLARDVRAEGFLPHRKKFDDILHPERKQDFLKYFGASGEMI